MAKIYNKDVKITGSGKLIVDEKTVVDGNGLVDLSSAAVRINFKDGATSSIDPSATAESGWINVQIDGVTKYIPYYAAS
tara:strand:- start:206 stop:442 length:237 start_codon:yes stop_codon:yes gene_type:complete